mgnify:CR=1 FL=1
MKMAMTRINNIEVQDVELMPSTLESGVLYVSKKYRTAAHLCCCGCGSKVVTPLKPGGWSLSLAPDGSASLTPSIGNFGFPCLSHYWIVDGKVDWALPYTPEEIAGSRARDHAVRQAYFDAQPSNWWMRVLLWLKRLFGLD